MAQLLHRDRQGLSSITHPYSRGQNWTGFFVLELMFEPTNEPSAISTR